MENYFANLFEIYIKEVNNFTFILTDSNILKQAGFTDNEIEIIKNIAFKKLNDNQILKQYIALQLIE